MSEKKGWGSSVLGLFVVRDDENADNAAAAGVAPGTDAAAPAADAAGASDAVAPDPGATFSTEPPAAPGGKVDFAAVYQAAGIDADEQARVAKAAELLHALPGGGEAAKPIVEAALKAFGVPVAEILATGAKEIKALEAYVAAGASDTQKVLAESQRRIAEFQQEIQRIRQVMDERVAEQQGVERSCGETKGEVQKVIDFFGGAPMTSGYPSGPASGPDPAARS
jgi:hypothetical protein